MHSAKDVIRGQLATSDFLFQSMLQDLSDDEYFKPPIIGANHAAWIVGHVAVSEDSMVSKLAGQPKRFPDEHELFRGGTTCHAEVAKYPSRGKIEEMMRAARAHTLEVLGAFDESRWSDPSPEGFPRTMFPTAGSVWALIGTHPYWHIGQLTVCRAALGKKRVLE